LSPIVEKVFSRLREQDKFYAQMPDFYIANSTVVAERIQRIYGKKAVPINYPIDTNQFIFSEQKDDFYLASARLLSYKRIDIIVEAFNWLGLPLLITGTGPERERLESRALENVRFLGHVSDLERKYLMSKARFVIVAALEDYGLVPIEANASGTPVISYGAGGVLDTQIPGVTGLFFDRQTPESLQAAIVSANQRSWDYSKIREHALNHFSEVVFFENVKQIVGEVCGEQISERLFHKSPQALSLV
jgi:glycosyltransferase involved in cell wall biosynthesis